MEFCRLDVSMGLFQNRHKLMLLRIVNHSFINASGAKKRIIGIDPQGGLLAVYDRCDKVTIFSSTLVTPGMDLMIMSILSFSSFE